MAVGLSRCPHCGAGPEHNHEFGSRPEDDDHPMMGAVIHMAKIGREAGPTDASLEEPEVRNTGDGPVVVPAGPEHQEGDEAVARSLSPADAAQLEEISDDEPTTGAPAGPERPTGRTLRSDWTAWAAASGYHGPCVEALTVAQIQALPDGPPAYDDDGLLVAGEDASEETVAAVEAYNVKALELYPSSGTLEPEDEPSEVGSDEEQ